MFSFITYCFTALSAYDYLFINYKEIIVKSEILSS